MKHVLSITCLALTLSFTACADLFADAESVEIYREELGELARSRSGVRVDRELIVDLAKAIATDYRHLAETTTRDVRRGSPPEHEPPQDDVAIRELNVGVDMAQSLEAFDESELVTLAHEIHSSLTEAGLPVVQIDGSTPAITSQERLEVTFEHGTSPEILMSVYVRARIGAVDRRLESVTVHARVRQWPFDTLIHEYFVSRSATQESASARDGSRQ